MEGKRTGEAGVLEVEVVELVELAKLRADGARERRPPKVEVVEGRAIEPGWDGAGEHREAQIDVVPAAAPCPRIGQRARDGGDAEVEELVVLEAAELLGNGSRDIGTAEEELPEQRERAKLRVHRAGDRVVVKYEFVQEREHRQLRRDGTCEPIVGELDLGDLARLACDAMPVAAAGRLEPAGLVHPVDATRVLEEDLERFAAHIGARAGQREEQSPKREQAAR
mmetsp:Transcript_29433/g.63338  ORF Transcript_29433/g.63338 Transcript_29433/m.63338 type:complete len:224 (-) Transcript_29433:79-750(-)